MVGERLNKAAQRDPVIREISNALGDRASNARNRPSKRLENIMPQIPNRNIGGGVAVGLVGAGIIRIIKDYVPMTTDVDVVDTEMTQGGVVYTVNVDAPMQDIAEAEAFMESAAGFTSVFTDLIEVQDAQILKTRMVKDTYEVKVLVRD